MKTRTITTTCAAALGIALGMAACTSTTNKPVPVAAAPAPPVSGTIGEELVSATATVKALDLKTRMVTLQRSDGSTIKFRAGDEVRNLPQVKVGDEVTVSYYESLAYEVKKPGEAEPGAAVVEAAGRAEPGEKPAAGGARAITVTATIAAIDKKAMTVTLRGPDGEETTVKARDPQKLDRVAVGDLIEITYTEGIAVSVETPQK